MTTINIVSGENASGLESGKPYDILSVYINS